MSTPEAARVYREPPRPEKLKGAYCPVLSVVKITRADKVARAKISLSWHRLCADVHSKTFYPSRNSRFTPASWDFPCAYYAETPTTCFAEKYGDQMVKHIANTPNAPFTIPAATAAAIGLYEITDSPAMNLCDLSDERTLLRLCLDLTTVYALDLSLTQRWAEAIARMDIKYDGIRYRSRHTGKLCQVLWDRPAAEILSVQIATDRKMPLLDAPFAWEVAAIVNARLSFAKDPGA
jgi:hypothetical protein